MRVVATAGHVDHGKSTLVLALTGTDPDRFAEEKARGLTIDLGFAFTTLPSGTEIGFVDVPGHVRFVKNMLAGVGAVEIALLVVAANEGWMPQTAEHVAILELLDIRSGLVAVTKADLVDAETLELAEFELADRLESTRLANWPVVAVDGISGRGLDELRAVLDAVLASAPDPLDTGRPRVWIDRVFSARGSGTVVTGTLTGGWFAVDQEVVVEPSARAARVRRIESRGAHLDRVAPGSRVALNLAGIEHDAVRRGDAVVVPGQWATPDVVDVVVHAAADHQFPRRGPVDAHVGSGEHVGALRLIGTDGESSGDAFARLELPVGLPLAPGDRVVLRSSARRATTGGAEVLDVAPTRRISDARRRLVLPLAERVLDARPWATAAELVPLAGVADGDAWASTLRAEGRATNVGGWLVAPATLEAVREQALAAVAAATDPAGIDLAALASRCAIDAPKLRAALADEPRLVVDRDVVRGAESTPIVDDPAARALLDALTARPFDPPAPTELGASHALVRALIRAGVLIDVDGVVFARAAYDDARDRIARAVVERGALTVSDVRDLLGSSRKYVVPLLTRLDAEGVTRRRGDERIPGARVAQPKFQP
jgi:selenocysteine-specific elongation factor